ncbi:MAG: CsgG/HfaB family protein [Elusimicrobia bacterium]|nr:CsgG/HfaB family protein [Elusimicrobiota bacterium]
MDRTIVLCTAALLAAGCAPSSTVRMQQAVSVRETQKVEAKMTGPKRRIGVVDFENKTAYGAQRLGTSASDILITELVKSEKFIVVERDKLNKIMEEQKLGQSGIVDSVTAVQVGKILGLNAMVTGSISQFGVKTGGADYLLTQSKQQVAECTVDIRVVDVETGQILYADAGKGVAKRGTGQVLGLGTRAGYDETLEGESLRAAIAKFTENIIWQVNKKPWSCRVAEVDKATIYLNAGLASGLNVGEKLKVYHLGREIKDPTTGLVLGNIEDEIADIEVVRHFGEDGSIAKIIKGTPPSKNDICRLFK